MKDSVWSALKWWKILRLDPTYQRAEQECYREMRRLRDLRPLSLYEQESFAQTKFSCVPKLESNSDFDGFLRIECLHLPYMRKFLTQFGDVIRFPISHLTEFPNEKFLEMAWVLRPAFQVTEDFVFVQNEIARLTRSSESIRRVEIRTVAVHTALPLCQVERVLSEQVQTIVRDLKKKHPLAFSASLEERVFKPALFGESVDLWAEKSRTGLGYEKLGLNWNWSKPSKENTDDDDYEGRSPAARLKGRVIKRVRYIRDEIAPFFQRNEPLADFGVHPKDAAEDERN